MATQSLSWHITTKLLVAKLEINPKKSSPVKSDDFFYLAISYKRPHLVLSRLLSSSKTERFVFYEAQKRKPRPSEKGFQINKETNLMHAPLTKSWYTQKQSSFFLVNSSTNNCRNVLLRHGAKCKAQTMVCKALSYRV